MDFKILKEKHQQHFLNVIKDAETLFITNIDKDVIWNTYLNAFPIEEQQGFNCNCCKSFLRQYGNVVAIKDNKLQTIWNFSCNEPYQKVVNELHKLVIHSKIRDVFVSKLDKLGVDYNFEQTDNGSIKWEHFHLALPNKFVNKSKDSEETTMGDLRTAKEVFKRSLEELTTDSVEITLELINQNSLYRGEEFKGMLQSFLSYKKQYEKLSEYDKDNFCWINSIKAGNVISKIRNTSIGTLLIDISNNVELDRAVTSFEKIVAPTNYKRPTTILTKGMIEKAQNRITEMGFENSLGRRFAEIDDITINNVIFANRDSKKAMNVFEELVNDIKPNVKSLNKIEKISIDDFVKNVIPTITDFDVLVENRHTNNLMSLISPIVKDSKTMFKWNNNFSWSYNNDVTDSIREMVKAAGGKVDGELRVSLSWYNYDDLDLHVIEPNRNEIYFSNKHSYTSGDLDVDMNAGSGDTRKAVENIIWTNKSRMLEGNYKVIINNFAKRENVDFGFCVEIECNGVIHTYEYNGLIENKCNVVVAEFEYKKDKGVKIISSIESKTSNKEIWNINTNQYQKVSTMMFSPNHWDGNEIGNRHYFFMLEKCKNPKNPRGFYNEFLHEDLMKEKRVFEALGGKMKVENSDNQLSGLGFSSTNRNSIICKVNGKFERILEITF